MATTNLGRVQGAGFFYTTASSGTSVALSTITPKNIKPLAGDCVIFPNGDVRKVTSVSSTTVTCGSVVASFKGATGATGPQGPAGPAGPVGPEGPAGPSGALSDPQLGDKDTYLNGTYLLKPATTGAYSVMSMSSGAVSLNNITYSNGEISLYILQPDSTRDTHLMGIPYTLKITSTGITKIEDEEIPMFEYIRLTES